MMGMPSAWACAAGAGLLVYRYRGARRASERSTASAAKTKRIERTRTKGLHDLQMMWAVHQRGGEEAMNAYIAARKRSPNGTIVVEARPVKSQLAHR
jgi:hypothetical protein